MQPSLSLFLFVYLFHVRIFLSEFAMRLFPSILLAIIFSVLYFSPVDLINYLFYLNIIFDRKWDRFI